LRFGGAQLTSWFGKPTAIVDGEPNESIANGEDPIPSEQRHINLTWNWASSDMKIELRIVRIRSIGARDERAYLDEVLADSDVISYSGHSGYGSEIQKLLVDTGALQSGRHYIFVLHGCNTFDSIGNALKKRFGDLNPGQNPDTYYDVIASITPTYVNFTGDVNRAVIENLLYQRPYSAMLSKLPWSMERLILTGERDNPSQSPAP
jgi:hypothetical protein